MRLELAVDEGGREIVAVGEASDLWGQLILDYDRPAASQFGLFAVDLRTLTADSPDLEPGFWEQWLGIAQQSLATFQATEIHGFPAGIATGQPIRFQLEGEIQVKSTVKTVTWDGTVTFEARRASGVATTSIPLADFGLPPAGTTGALSAATIALVTVDLSLVEVEPQPDPIET